MIPVRLSLNNFMPYKAGVAPIDFTSMHIASICGDNGSGKSSLIDAMTWALWGKARARSDDELIHQGENSMQVVFDFAVGSQVYRVIRKRTRGKSKRAPGQSSLDLFIDNEGTFLPISGDRIDATEKKIIEVLHMDYDTFINSAFLRQGHADQFTVAKAVERKTVLTSILGLATYDQLEQDARDIANRRGNTRLQVETNIRDIDAELSHKPAYEEEMAQAQRQLTDIEKDLAGLEDSLIRLRQEKELLSAKQSQAVQMEEQINRMNRDRRRWQEQAAQNSLRVEEYARLLEKRKDIEDGYANLIQRRKQNDELGQKSRVVSSLREHQHKLELAIIQASQGLVREHTLVEVAINDLQAKYQQGSVLRAALQQARLELEQLAASDISLTALKDTRQTGLAELRQFEAERARVEAEAADLSGKLALLESGTGAKCPLCEQELGLAHINLIKDKYNKEKQEKGGVVHSLTARIAARTAELARLEREVSQSETRLNRARADIQGKIGMLTRQLTEAEEAGGKLAGQKQQLADIEERQSSKQYALEEQTLLQRLEAEMAEIAYDVRQHDIIRAEITRLADEFETPKHKLEQAERLMKEASEAAAAAQQAAQELQAGLADYNNKKAMLESELTVFSEVSASLVETEASYRALSSRQTTAREIIGSTREKLNRCAQLEKTKIERTRQLQQSLTEEEIFRELSEAFGKKGVQALLIEIALPEIEAEANRLLSRMTDNRLHVKFETQRETKKGDLLETLDITISDELGTRNYELFSGGEAFRINFAIRVALSKVLARRAGAPLPTLIVDEGFGTQDASGMEKLREAITSVQDDFEKILVITHIEEFRDAFPVRIDVIKGPQGSTIEIS